MGFHHPRSNKKADGRGGAEHPPGCPRLRASRGFLRSRRPVGRAGGVPCAHGGHPPHPRRNRRPAVGRTGGAHAAAVGQDPQPRPLRRVGADRHPSPPGTRDGTRQRTRPLRALRLPARSLPGSRCVRGGRRRTPDLKRRGPLPRIVRHGRTRPRRVAARAHAAHRDRRRIVPRADRGDLALLLRRDQHRVRLQLDAPGHRVRPRLGGHGAVRGCDGLRSLRRRQSRRPPTAAGSCWRCIRSATYSLGARGVARPRVRHPRPRIRSTRPGAHAERSPPTSSW